MNNNEALILSGEGYNLQVSPDIMAEKATLIEHSTLIVEIADPVSSDAATQQLKKLGAMRILVEKSRKTVKEPVLLVGKKIDDLAKEFQADIEAEENRLKKLQGDYAMVVETERRRVLAEIEAKRKEEERQRWRAEEAAKKAASEAEAARIAAEEAAFNATTPEEDAEAERKAAEAKASEAARIAAEQAEAARVAALPVSAPVEVPVAPKGVKMVADFEVIDLHQLYVGNPSLVELTAKRREILSHIERGMTGDVPPAVPGLHVFMKPYVR